MVQRLCASGRRQNPLHSPARQLLIKHREHRGKHLHLRHCNSLRPPAAASSPNASASGTGTTLSIVTFVSMMSPGWIGVASGAGGAGAAGCPSAAGSARSAQREVRDTAAAAVGPGGVARPASAAAAAGMHAASAATAARSARPRRVTVNALRRRDRVEAI